MMCPCKALAWVMGAACLVASLGSELCLQDPQQGTPERQQAKETDGVEAEVREFIAHYIETLEGRDEKAIRSLFVADKRFAWFTDGAKSYSTPDDVLAGMKRYAEVRFETAISELVVVALGAHLASASSRFETKLTIPGAENHAYGGVITWLLEKEAESGKWQVLLGHTSTPGGPPGQDAGKNNRDER